MDSRENERMTVHRDGVPIYDIVLAENFDGLVSELSVLGTEKKKLCIITDSNVANLYLDEVKTRIAACCRKVSCFVFPAGEENKNLTTVQGVYEHLILNHFDRKDLLVALGGGVTGDLCGFVAATYLRGVDFVQIPTTLLSQVDSSIGGKTGVDFDSYKNMVGAFHMPRLVYTNVSVLKSLSDEQYSSGMGEVVKHGLIRDRAYFDWILKNQEAILLRDAGVCRQMVRVSNEIKRDVVEIDPTEQNERATLNFGHTLGHAIEKLKNFTMLHGHCVALGALAAMRLCVSRGQVSEGDVRDYKRAMEVFGMPVYVNGLDKKEVLTATKNDKKMEAGIIKFILLHGVGNAYVDKTVTDKEMEEALNTILQPDKSLCFI